MDNNEGEILNSSMNLAARRKVKRIHIVEMGMTVILKELSARQLLSLERNSDNVHQLAQMIVDEEGRRIFTTEDDIANLGELPATVFSELLVEALALNGTAPATVNETIKNSDASRNGDFASVSQ